ncbi:hypothetical protein HPB52_011535 [Rhipicephalus sanguineus]|uniref:Transferrin-like domain-containing protein n=1 Tax=Rhipicephalus sanguineus TaxID=34632 RepID=A0A9D4T9P4_RHISA|nr:hypothetical protein HPB52_011535 [Rhipicephalus sanguineus]
MVSLCLSTPDTSLYQKAKQNLTSQSSVRVVGRQREMETMKEFLHSHLRAGTSGSLYVSGAPGTGKTACLSQILESSKNLFKFQYVFVNCMTLQSSSAIYQKIISGLDLSPACSSHLETIRRRLTTKGHPMIIVMDEIDQLDSKNQTVLYSLFELPQLKNSRATIFGIANALDLTDRVLPHLQAYGCRPTLLHFAPYSIDEIVAILMDRLNECHAVIQPQAIQFCARKIAACTGDVRKALDICRRAVEIVERSAKTQQVLVPRPEHGYNLGSPKKAPLKVVNMAHISSVLADVFGSSAMGSKDLNATLPLQQKLLLCTLVALLKVKKLRDVLLGKLQEAYMRICQRHQCSTDQSDFQSLSTLLESRGLITVKRHKELRLSKRAAFKDQCMNFLDNGQANLVELDPGEVYTAGRFHSVIPILAERYGRDRDAGYYSVAVIHARSEFRSLNDLRNKSVCFTSVGDMAGWVVPMATLIHENILEVTDCNNLVKSAASFFGPSCAPNSLIDKHNPTE